MIVLYFAGGIAIAIFGLGVALLADPGIYNNIKK
jgi:hypothetical protein